MALAAQIEVYERMRDSLERDHDGEWVVILDGEILDFFETGRAAAESAVAHFGYSPYLIRQIGRSFVSPRLLERGHARGP